jgi:hypothetical protein
MGEGRRALRVTEDGEVHQPQPRKLGEWTGRGLAFKESTKGSLTDLW